MATTTLKKPTRSARLETRLTPDQKALIERAAAYEGRSVTDFVVHTLQAEARKVVEGHETIKLNAAQSRKLVEALLKPAKPTAALRRAARRHEQLVESR